MSSDSDTSSSKRAREGYDSDDSLELKRMCKATPVDLVLHDAFGSQEPPSPDGIEGFPVAMQPLAPQPLVHEDAVARAAATGQVKRLKSLLSKSKGDLTRAMFFAATNGHFHVVTELLCQLKPPYSEYLSCNGYLTLKKAVMPAARNGHHDIVVNLLKWMEVDGEMDKETAWEVLDEAASSGQLEVVKFVAGYLIRTKDDEDQCAESKAVSHAIDGSHADVVVYLLRYPWNLAYYFIEAVEKEQHAVARSIYMAYPLYYDGKNLFAEMAGDGFSNAVTYMYERGYCGAELIQDAFVKASATRRNEVLEYLLTTGRVSMEGFERGLEAAATSGSIAAVRHICSKRLVPHKGIHQAFEMSGSLAVTKYLYEKEKIPAASITAALKNVTGIGKMIPIQKKDREAIALFLCQVNCIPPDVTCTAFAMTAYDMVSMVDALYDKPCISRDIVCAALQQAADSGHINIVRVLIGKTGISQVVKQVALLNAALKNHVAIVRLMMACEQWPLDIVRQALKVTTSRKLKQFLREKLQSC
ncbi:hypothetical protein PHYPSEUDO_008540 [Phytophthora pseudosyringae]|uniref:Ankyrin repeat protein n=1 Tax=Phytophthora pseudosyringae TaxID=221518 RepID=A0A8T1VES8_9STRA|nr:hypothetical protein PHYPSEUDO_008540 [Phytophthora pseudosyringae]